MILFILDQVHFIPDIFNFIQNSSILYQTSSISRKTSSISYQTSSISYQTSSISYQTSSISYQTSSIQSPGPLRRLCPDPPVLPPLDGPTDPGGPGCGSDGAPPIRLGTKFGKQKMIKRTKLYLKLDWVGPVDNRPSTD